jgi:hypothetical protein
VNTMTNEIANNDPSKICWHFLPSKMQEISVSFH